MIWNGILTFLGLVLLILLWIALYDSNRFVQVKYVIRDVRIRKHCRAVVLADLHNKCYGKDNALLLASIREAKPDMILIAGDLLTAKPGETLKVAEHVLQELARDYPIYYANGNHEQRLKLYAENYGDMGQAYDEILNHLGVKMLINRHLSLPEYGLTIYGTEIDRFYYKRFKTQEMKKDYLPGILGCPENSSYNILLAHNPDYFPQYAEWGADLVLAGHVHGGMIRIPVWGKGVASPKITLFPKYDGGEFHENQSKMFLSRGLGMHTIPIRLFNPGELLVIDFQTE